MHHDTLIIRLFPIRNVIIQSDKKSEAKSILQSIRLDIQIQGTREFHTCQIWNANQYNSWSNQNLLLLLNNFARYL